jgi:hypothetical protein
MMTRIAIAVLLLALTGCVDKMPEGDTNDQLLNKSWHADAPEPEESIPQFVEYMRALPS